MLMPNMKSIILFDELKITIPVSYWNFLCENRFFSINPGVDEIQAEFVTGTGITKNKKHMWSVASLKFIEYIEDLMEIKSMDINKMARDLIQDERKNDASS